VHKKSTTTPDRTDAERSAPGVIWYDETGQINDGAYGAPANADKPDFIQVEERGWQKLVTLSER
jgi:hypothetical protein